MDLVVSPVPLLSREQLVASWRDAHRLPALSSTSNTLRELLDDDGTYLHQISDVIRRDPSLTSRVLRVVNSVYYGLPHHLSNIEEAVFLMGIRQVRHLAMITPIIEDFQALTARCVFPWRLFWQHSLATALLTNELLTVAGPPEDESGYLAGLLHDVGKIVIAAFLPAHFHAVRARVDADATGLLGTERDIIGADHAEIGALFLETQGAPHPLIAAVRWHHEPEKTDINLAAAVEVADLLVRHARLGRSGNQEAVAREDCLSARGWALLFKGASPEHLALAQAAGERLVRRLPVILDGLV